MRRRRRAISRPSCSHPDARLLLPDLERVGAVGERREVGGAGYSQPFEAQAQPCADVRPEPISFDRWQDLENRPFPTLSVISDRSELSGIGITSTRSDCRRVAPTRPCVLGSRTGRRGSSAWSWAGAPASSPTGASAGAMSLACAPRTDYADREGVGLAALTGLQREILTAQGRGTKKITGRAAGSDGRIQGSECWLPHFWPTEYGLACDCHPASDR